MAKNEDIVEKGIRIFKATSGGAAGLTAGSAASSSILGTFGAGAAGAVGGALVLPVVIGSLIGYFGVRQSYRAIKNAYKDN